jgi:TonB family protein
MHDRVADVLAQRAALDRGAGTAIALSVLLHGGLAAIAVYSVMHAAPTQPASFVTIKFAPISASQPQTAARTTRVDKPAAPKVEAPKPKVDEPQPKIEPPKAIEPPKTTAKPEKNTVPLSPFGRSTKNGAETPATTPAPTPPAAASTTAPVAGTTTDVPIGGAGITGLEGGDFPYALYLQSMNRKIGAVWTRPQVTPGTAAIVYFRIQRDGTIIGATIETPSGNGTFDRAALSAVRSASPLNPLPFGYSGPFLGVRLTFK